jgi:hypothetical protein
MSTMVPALTADGIEKLVSSNAVAVVELVPVILQVIAIDNPGISSTGQERIAATISDGSYSYRVLLATRLHYLVASNQLRIGSIVKFLNYVTQPMSSDVTGVLCLDLSIIGQNDVVIGTPVRYAVPVVDDEVAANFVGSLAEGFCHHCQQDPCDWFLHGPSVVDSVRTSHGIMPINVDRSVLNKSCRYAAYSQFAHIKFGYLGKGKRVPLPDCVVRGIRVNFPDANHFYVGFIPTRHCDD